MAATRRDRLSPLAALTSAALALPGLQAQAAIPVAQPQFGLMHGHYQESGERMHVEVYHSDFAVPLTERIELAFSIDRDTYAGASPAFNLPESMANQAKYKQQSNGGLTNQLSLEDIAYVITGASSGANQDHDHGFNEMLTIFGLEEYQTFTDGRAANAVAISAISAPLKTSLLDTFDSGVSSGQASKNSGILGAESTYASEKTIADSDLASGLNTIDQDYSTQLAAIDARLPALYSQFVADSNQLAVNKTTALNNYIAATPRPADPASVSSGGLIDFENLAQAAVYGIANHNSAPGGFCTGSGPTDCYYQDGMAIGRVDDGTTTAHLHQYALAFDPDTFAITDYALEYHGDSPGIFIRAVNGNAFSLDSMAFDAHLSGNNPGHTANDYWEILGFNTALDSSLANGDGTNYASRIAYQTISNGFNGTITLTPNSTAANCAASSSTCQLNSAFNNINAVWIHYHGYPKTPTNGKIFNVIVNDIVFSPVSLPTTQQTGWDNDYDSYRAVQDALYQSELTRITNEYNAEVTAISSSNQAAIDALTNEKNQKTDDLNTDYQARLASYQNAKTTAIAALTQTYNTKVAELTDTYNQGISSVLANERALSETYLIQTYQNLLNQMVPGNPAPIQRYQQQPLETRTQPTFSGKYYFDNTTLGISAGMSEEPDFVSNFSAVNLSHEFNQKLSTLSFGYSYSGNHVTRSGSHSHAAEGGNDPHYPTLNGYSQYQNFSLAFSQVLNKNTLFQSTVNFNRQTGYLSNPYKFVYIRGEVTAAEYYYLSQQGTSAIDWKSITNLEMVGTEIFREVRPGQRNQWSFSNRINRHIPELDASLNFDYRFFIDDWGINSHTFDLQWHQALPFELMLTPNIRYYSQSQAEFFAPYFLQPRADGHYSSDYRLASYAALSYGLSISKQFGKGVKLDAGIDFYDRQSQLKINGGPGSSYADYSYYMLHAGLNINLSAPGSHDTGHAGHHHHQSAAVPSGVMFAEMMNTPGEWMAGYRYTYANQTGAMLQGSTPVSDASLLNAPWCNPANCQSRPAQMSMNMHMLELMYAPTDWLNLMLMPQLMDMKMSMAQIPGANPLSHAGHSSGGLGDTQMVALFNLFEAADQHVHIGIGFSAPTGKTDMTIDGQKNGERQDYGMQLGSGTWDFKPSLTYTGHWDDWSWGAQLSGIKRLQNKNGNGYALGDAFQATAWGGYRLSDNISASIRGIYSELGRVKGQFDRVQSLTSSVDYSGNYGGHFYDVGFGLNATLPEGIFAGQKFGVEWLQPVASNFNGYQLNREGSLNATWNFSF